MTTSDLFESIPNLNPATLAQEGRGYEAVYALYDRFVDDLAPLTAEMTGHRQRLMDAGYSCDFSDRESELLYLLIRAMRPSTVVEISPCHGYSTNYILAALTHNGAGELHSYEIVDQVYGKPTEKVIRDNQLPWVDQARLHVHVGDATTADIPNPDFLFLDSAHEAWFASWYFRHLVPRAKACLVHDILIDQPMRGTLVPKGPFMGIRESVHVLKTLNLNDKRAMSVAAFGREFDANFVGRITARYSGAPERSIFFQGHEQTKAAARVHEVQMQLHEWQHRVIDGDRSVMREVQALSESGVPWFARLAAASLFPLAGYREHAMRAEFGKYYDSLMEGLDSELVSVSDLVAALEVGAQLGSPALVSRALNKARQKLPAPIVRFYGDHYGVFGMKLNAKAARLVRLASGAATRLGF